MNSPNARRVMIGFLNLTEAEKAEVIREVLDINQRPTFIQESKKSDLLSEERRVGPKNSICSCCGR